MRLTALCIGAVVGTAPVLGHRLDECLQAALIGLKPDGADVELDLTPGAAVAPTFLEAMDSNHDGRISQEEGMGYGRRWLGEVGASVDGRLLRLELAECVVPSREDLLAGQGVLRLHAKVGWRRLAPGAHRFEFENRFRPAPSQFLVNALKPESSDLRITGQQRDETQAELRLSLDVLDSAPPHAPIGKGRAPALGAAAVVVAGLAAFIVRLRRSTGPKLPTD